MKDKSVVYDRDYYENGIVSGKSCYMNYRWMPELTIRMAHKIIRHLDLKEHARVLDFGCAKGYLVRALRILDIDAYGCDVSDYAIANVDPEVRPYCRVVKASPTRGPIPFKGRYDWIITKDVLEHLDEGTLDRFLRAARRQSDSMFHVIPLGNGKGHYVIPEYEHDHSHMLAKPTEWWIDKFETAGWSRVTVSLSVPGVKDNWLARYPDGNGFFIVHAQ